MNIGMIIFQAFLFAVTCFVGVGSALQRALINMADMANLYELQSMIEGAGIIFYSSAAVAWGVSMVILIKTIVKKRRLPDYTVNDSGDWFVIFIPVMYLMLIGCGIVMLSAVGFFVAGVIHNFAEEDTSVWCGIISMVLTVWRIEWLSRS